MKKISFRLVAAMMAMLMAGATMLTSCDKDDDKDDNGDGGNSKYALVRTNISNVTTTTATLKSTFVKADGTEISKEEGEALMKADPHVGFCLVEGQGTPTTKDRTIDCTESIMEGHGTMTGTFEGLRPNTMYSVRAWATLKGSATFYGDVVTFRTHEEGQGGGGEEEGDDFINLVLKEINTVYTNGCKAKAYIDGFDGRTDIDVRLIQSFGFCIANEGSVPTVNDRVYEGTPNEKGSSFEAEIKDEQLKHNNWVIRAFLVYDEKIYYSNSRSFSTIDAEEEGEDELVISATNTTLNSISIYINGRGLNGQQVSTGKLYYIQTNENMEPAEIMQVGIELDVYQAVYEGHGEATVNIDGLMFGARHLVVGVVTYSNGEVIISNVVEARTQEL